MEEKKIYSRKQMKAREMVERKKRKKERKKEGKKELS